MSLEFELKDRNVIPNWRDFKRTIQLEEHVPVEIDMSEKKFDISRALKDWNDEHSLGTAADLVNCSFISGLNDDPKIIEACNFLKNYDKNVPSPILEIVELVLKQNDNVINPNNTLLEKEIPNIEALVNDDNKSLVYKLLNKTRRKVSNELHNAIVWVELARLHSIVGNSEKAEKAILTALGLAPDNRFVLRSATRFFVHSGKAEKALFFLRKAPSIKHDPWLVSAHISTSSAIGRFSPFLKIGNELIQSNNFSDFALTELSSSLGTLQFKDGNVKKAQAFLKKSLKSPNDNSLAQHEWLSRQDHRLFVNPFSYKSVLNPFEAFAFEYFYKGQWKDALDCCLKWFVDTPYSKRPVALGAYIAGCLLKDYNTGIAFCRAGLKANPDDPMLLNNLVYILLLCHNYKEAESPLQQLTRVDFTSLSEDTKMTVKATFGMAAMRQNKMDIGIDAYKRAIADADKQRNSYKKISR